MRRILITSLLFLIIYCSIVYSQTLPDDPYFKAQVYLYNDNITKYDAGFLDLYNYYKNNRDEILGHYNTYKGTNYPVVAIIDTDFNITDPDIKDRIYINTDEIPDNNLDDDNNGWIDDHDIINIVDGKTYKTKNALEEKINNKTKWFGEELYNTKYPPVDEFDKNPYYHGQVVATIIAASINNNTGLAGIIPDEIKILPIQAGHKAGFLWTTIRDSIDYIIDMKKEGVNIVAVNMSFGGNYYERNIFGKPATIGGKDIMEEKLKKLAENNILFVVAAGNNSHSLDIADLYPASYGLENSIVVGAASASGRASAPSNYGDSSVDIFAVAQFDNSSVNVNDYFYRLIDVDEIAYTSFATAVVTGSVAVAALLYPECNSVELKELILESYRPTSKLYKMAKKGGIVALSGKDGVGLVTDGKLNYHLRYKICKSINNKNNL